jgi:hypothetical protein
LLHPADRLWMHARTIVQDTIDGCRADTRLQRNILHEKAACHRLRDYPYASAEVCSRFTSMLDGYGGLSADMRTRIDRGAARLFPRFKIRS